MKAKQENSGHKFVRRNSNSPWETSVNLQIS